MFYAWIRWFCKAIKAVAFIDLMNTRGSRGNSSNGNRRRKAPLGLDLNVPPSDSGRDQEGPSTRGVPQEGQAATLPTNLIDVDAIEDEVVFSSPVAFAEAKINSRRRHTRNSVIDVDSGNTVIITERVTRRATRPAVGNRNKRRRIPPNQPIINCEHYIDLEGSFNSKKKSPEKPIPPPPPPPAPAFSCPICMGSLVEEMSTKCGHIFCKACIKTAISFQTKCPTCRKKVIAKDIIRVYLPTTS